MIPDHSLQKSWESNQYQLFDSDWDNKWSKKFPEQNSLKAKILNLPYDGFYHVNNAFGKLDKALQISDYLFKLRKSQPPQDTDKIIVTVLTSSAEAIYRISEPNEYSSNKLVTGFFRSIEDKIKYKISGYVEGVEKTVFSACEVLYLVRNDYIHNGNFTGLFFNNETSDSNATNMGTFYFRPIDMKDKLIQAVSECKLSYHEFTRLFLVAFITNIEHYCNA